MPQRLFKMLFLHKACSSARVTIDLDIASHVFPRAQPQVSPGPLDSRLRLACSIIESCSEVAHGIPSAVSAESLIGQKVICSAGLQSHQQCTLRSVLFCRAKPSFSCRSSRVWQEAACRTSSASWKRSSSLTFQ